MHAVADTRRRALFERVARSTSLSVADLTAGSGVTQGAVSQHLKVLRDAGLVHGERRGRQVLYSANPAALAPLTDWLGHYEEFWRDRLARLRTLVAEIEGE